MTSEISSLGHQVILQGSGGREKAELGPALTSDSMKRTGAVLLRPHVVSEPAAPLLGKGAW